MATFSSVTIQSSNKTITPWSVVSLDPSENFEELFRSIKSGKYSIIKTSPELSDAVLKSVGVGHDKMSLSLVQKELNTVEICSVFGSFVKFSVSLNEPVQAHAVVTNAFEIMMKSQSQLSAPTLPDPVTEHTKKDKLFNDVRWLLEQKGMKFSPDQLQSSPDQLQSGKLYQ